MYVAIDRKPKLGCKIQEAACAKLGIMICFHLVKSNTEVEADSVAEDDEGMLHGTKVLTKLVSPWDNSGRVVCADSYFASFPAAEYLLQHGLNL